MLLQRLVRPRCATDLVRAALAAAACWLAVGAHAAAPPAAGVPLPTGQRITPGAAHGALFQDLDPGLPARPAFRAGQAVSLALSPDGRTLLVLTSGYNRLNDAAGRPVPAASNEYVFVYDVAGAAPVKRQVVPVANTFLGIAWQPDGSAFHVSGGVDDVVHTYVPEAGRWVERQPPIALGHRAGLGIDARPMAAGLAVSPDGRRLLVANFQNDSVSLVDVARRAVVAELDLRPGKLAPDRRGVPGGEFPVAVAWSSDGKAYVASQRDREIVVLRVAGDRLAVTGRLATRGTPTALLPDPARDRLFVACDNSDTVLVIDTARDTVQATVAATAPPLLLANPRDLKGAGPNGLALAPDGRTLFVTLGGLNAVAVVPLEDRIGARRVPQVAGLIPTGWYPTAVAVSADGRRLHVVNGKSPAGPNPGACRDTLSTAPGALSKCNARNQYVWQREKAGFLTLPMPDARELARLTWQVAANDNFPAARRAREQGARMAFLRQHIRHVIYVLKENRSYDQILGDLEVGDGDPRLTLLPEPFTPNHHRLARRFVTLDAFFDSGETSNNGWIWSTAARSTDFMEKEAPVNYAGRGLQIDSEGVNRGINVGLPQPRRRALDPRVPDDPDLLPGPADVAAPDGAGGEAGAGYLWDGALAAGLSLRNYGFYGDSGIYDPQNPRAVPPVREPFAAGIAVFSPTKATLVPYTDPYYRGYDMRYADFWRIREWQRDFAALLARHAVPNLMLVRLPHDHFGDFAAALDGVNTVETQMADNDYAVGLLVETVAKSPIHDSTLVFVIEDDAQNGADHVSAHRSLALVAGPYVKQHAVVSRRYTTVSLLRTIEDVLGIPPLGLNDGLAEPMAEVFDPAQRDWSYEAVVPDVLRTTTLPLPQRHAGAGGDACGVQPPRSMQYWQDRLGDQDYRVEDHLDTARFNAALWQGRKGGAPPPAADGRDLRRNRAALLAAFRAAEHCAPARGAGWGARP